MDILHTVLITQTITTIYRLNTIFICKNDLFHSDFEEIGKFGFNKNDYFEVKYVLMPTIQIMHGMYGKNVVLFLFFALERPLCFGH